VGKYHVIVIESQKCDIGHRRSHHIGSQVTICDKVVI